MVNCGARPGGVGVRVGVFVGVGDFLGVGVSVGVFVGVSVFVGVNVIVGVLLGVGIGVADVTSSYAPTSHVTLRATPRWSVVTGEAGAPRLQLPWTKAMLPAFI